MEKFWVKFPDRRADIIIEKAEVNAYLQDLRLNRSRSQRRAILFLDPFGMQVSWQTTEAIARTRGIDTWILFPLSAVNRL